VFSPWLRAILRPLWPQYRALAQYSLFVNLLALATPVFVLQIYDRVVFHSGMSTLQGLTLGMVVVIFFDFLLRQARSRLMQQVSLRIDAALGRQLFYKLTALPLRTLESRPGPFWQSIFRDMDQVRNMLGGPSAVLLVDLPFVLLFIGLIFIIATPIVWVLFAALGAFVGLAWWSSNQVQKASLDERKTQLARDALVAEIVAGRNTVKALAIGENLRPVWEDRHVDAIESSIRRGQVSDRFGNLGMEMTICTTIVMTVVGAIAILDQQMTIGGLIAANMLSTRIIAPLNQLVAAWRGFATYREAMGRLDEMLSLPEERQETELEFDRPAGVLGVQKLVFHYNEAAPPVIDELTFTLKPGGLHGIVGRNGSGKSTLLKLMQGLYTPTSGRVLLDDADVQQFSRGELSRWFGYVPQECFLFNGTVRDNICKVVPDAPDERVLALTRRLGLHDDIVDLPDGYNTHIGEAGARLSAGQRQKIVIARALLYDPPVLLLDEPTSNLDRPAEEALRSLLTEMARSQNIIMVTHSPILLAACQNLIVMDKGKVAMAGATGDILPRLFGGQGTPPALERKV